MDHKVKPGVTSRILAEALGLELTGPELPITCVSALSSRSDGALCFDKSGSGPSVAESATVIAASAATAGRASVIISGNPRLDFARALVWLEKGGLLARALRPARVDPSARIGQGVVLGNGVEIGRNTVIHHNVVIGDDVIIGDNCVIKSCAVIGEDGFGFERDEDGIPIRLVHLGRVIIGNDVEIGSLTTVCRGTLGDTIIHDHVKVDDHVHIAHNVVVHMGAMIIACAEVSGGVEIGAQAWVGPNSSVIQKLKIGEKSTVGIGANVIRAVEAGAVVAGNPARTLSK